MNPSPFYVYLYNFGYGNYFDTFNQAVEYMKRAGFESSVTQKGILLAKYSPIGGFSLVH